MITKKLKNIFLLLICVTMAFAQVDLEELLQSEHNAQSRLWNDLMDHEDHWFAGQKGQMVAENILAYQRESGGWPKNIDFTKPVTRDVRLKLDEYSDEYHSTIDNGATYTQLNFLAKIINVTGQDRYILSFLKGLDYLLDAQYENGGWPQFYPLVKGYYTHVTYNDDAMTGVLYLLYDIVHHPQYYNFVDSARRERSAQAVASGIQCILKTQIREDGKLTAWCAQYDEKTLEPSSARAYELVSLSGKESVGILRFLMSLEEPSPEIIDAVQHGIAWLDLVRINGIRVKRVPDSGSATGFNRVVVQDPDAPSLWARFYLIGSNKPFFSDRDGKIYDRLDQISSERRNAYGWLGDWPATLLNSDYPTWLKRWSIDVNVLEKPVH